MTAIQNLISTLKLAGYESISIEMLEKNIIPTFLEKEQEHILDAYNHGYWESEDPTKTADMYYNETFGKRHNDVIQ